MTPAALWVRFDPAAAVGSRLYGYREVTSTMDIAWGMADLGAAHGTALLAAAQTQGRGRFGRPWVAAPGEALLLSVILRSPADVVPKLSVLASLAVRDAVRDLSGIACMFKWPNDLEVNGRKLAGILTEVRTSTKGVSVAVVGVGLNLNLDPAKYRDLGAMISIESETGTRIAPSQAAIAVLGRLDSWHQRAERGDDVIGQWRRSLSTLGKHVTVRQRDRTISGRAEDVTADGHLVLRTADGATHALAEGDVSLRG